MEWREELLDLINTPMTFVHDQMKKGADEPSFVSEWLDKPGRADDKALIPETAASVYAGGADTTVSAISTFFVAMLYYPEHQKIAQKEIDEVLGKDRLPTFDDGPSLPYVEALYKEVMRWQPLARIAIPHKVDSETDDEYNGMRIPAKAMVIGNVWNMLRDPNVHKDPETFNPRRFFGANKEPDPEEVVFGFGRRRCPGVAVAQTSVWLSIALTLAAYNVTPIIGEDREPILPSLEYSIGIVSHPKPFHCKITPRSDKLKETLEEIMM